MWYFKFALICSIFGPCAELTGNGDRVVYDTEEACLQSAEAYKQWFIQETGRRYGIIADAVVHDFVCEQKGDPV